MSHFYSNLFIQSNRAIDIFISRSFPYFDFRNGSVIRAELAKMEIDLFMQSHRMSSGHEKQNIYGIVRAPRSAGEEALLLHIPLNEENEHSCAAAALGLHLVHLFSGKKDKHVVMNDG